MNNFIYHLKKKSSKSFDNDLGAQNKSSGVEERFMKSLPDFRTKNERRRNEERKGRRVAMGGVDVHANALCLIAISK